MIEFEYRRGPLGNITTGKPRMETPRVVRNIEGGFSIFMGFMLNAAFLCGVLYCVVKLIKWVWYV